ncbi:hypothetical protein [Streptomyces sp. NBC_01727]|uniref:hypothetical protein n=1 Tax=Streptomyces sp. NBC_01727 TaxID=2975924 RepID=UPI002E110161|nr:hypothetical protein OIE76_42515 [Streptomyces sp. NBC_01727]
MNVTRPPAASLATERSDADTLALLEAIEVPLPDFTSIDLDVAFGTPLEMYAANPIPHEQLDGLDITAAIAAIEARENRTLAARDIAATEPTATKLVRERWSTCSSPTPRSCASRRRSRACRCRSRPDAPPPPGLRTRLLHPELPPAAPDVGAGPHNPAPPSTSYVWLSGLHAGPG